MQLTLDRATYLPAANLNAREVRRDGLDAVVYVWEEARGDGRMVAMAKGFAAKSNKPRFYYHFQKVETRDAYVTGFLDSAARSAAFKAEQRAKAAAERASLNAAQSLPVGSILTDSWGYEQTNVDAFQVVGHFGRVGVIVRAIGLETVRGSSCGMSEYVRPVKDNFGDAPELRCRMTSAGAINVGHRRPSLWSGRDLYQSHYH